MAQEQSNTHQCIATVMTFRINNSTIAFTTDYSAYFLHFSGYVHFAHSRSKVFLTILTGYIAQRTCRTQVRNRIARSMLQHIVSHTYQRIFFTIHLSIFANHCQTVHVRVNNKSHIRFTTLHQVHYVTQVLFKRFRIVLEVTCRLTVELLYMLHTQLFQQFRQNNTTHRVYTVNSHAEIRFSDSFYIYQVECQHTIYMFLIISQILAIRAQMVYISKFKFFCLSNTKYFIAFGCIQKFATFIQQFQSVPLFGVVRCCQDNTATGTFHGYSQFSSWSRSQINVDYIPAHTHQSTYYYILHHFTRNTGVASYYNFVAFYRARFANKCGIR